MGFGLIIGFIEHLELITTSNWSAVTNSHTFIRIRVTLQLLFTTSYCFSDWSHIKVMLQLAVSRLVYLGVKPRYGAQDQILITVRQLQVCWCGARYLMRGGVCHLQLLLVLTSAVILRSKSCRIHDHVLLSQIWDSVTWRATSLYLYPPGTGWPCYTPRHRVPFSLPPTTRRPMVEVFEPASTRGFQLKNKVKVKVILWPTVSQPVCLGLKPHLGPKTRFLLLSDSCRAPSLTKERVYSLQLLLAIASTVILGSESHRTDDYMLLSQIRDSCNLEGQVPIFLYPPGTRWPN
jgi:hypothetical protein